MVALLLAGAATLFYLYSERKAADARRRVPSTDLVFEDIRLGTQYSSHRVSGRARNRNGQYTISTAKLRVTLKDCADETRCDVVGETDSTIYLNIPPGHVRDFDNGVYFS